MSTISFYQKYRPANFDEVIGQDEIIQTIGRQIENDQVSHAYLFYGTRGLGKTSIARLMARKLGIASEDLYEIDAASNRGIDDVREIREGVKSQPFSSPYKMYIIDEVHMLTKDAFNALLKTLEEPPKYVIFVLATTELHKVLDTIKSRTQIFTFKRPNQDDLRTLLNSVAEKESLVISDNNMRSLITRADGSYRDALSQLQQYAANPDGYNTLQNDSGLIIQIIGWLSNSKVDESELLDQINLHPDPNILYRQLLAGVSDELFKKVSGKSTEANVTSTQLEIILNARNFFSSEADLLTARSGLNLVLAKLVEYKNK